MLTNKSRLAWAMIPILGVLVFAIVRCGSATPATTIPTGAVSISIPSGATGRGTAAFGTNPLHVPVGSKVVWTNADSMPHTATSNSAIWDTGSIAAGNVSAAVTFSTAGTFPYTCTIHGGTSMSGVIQVP